MKLDYKSLKFEVMVQYVDEHADELQKKNEKVFDEFIASMFKDDGSKNTLAMKKPFFTLTNDAIEFDNAPKGKADKKADPSIDMAKKLQEKYGKKKK